jgi:hypothetical protein
MMRVFIVILLLFFNFGCGILESSRDPQWVKEARSNNKDPDHIHSCGPEALHKAFGDLGIKTSKRHISEEIQNGGNCLRDFLSIFNNRARQITFPHEMKRILKNHGYKMTKVSSLREIDQNKDTAILLVHKKNTFNYHWLCYPLDNVNFFGKETVLDSVYIVKLSK